MTISPQAVQAVPAVQATVIQLPTSAPVFNDTWISNYDGKQFPMKFARSFKLQDRSAWPKRNKAKGNYIISLVPDDKLALFDSMPIINEYSIYTGQSDSCLYMRFYMFLDSLNQASSNYMNPKTTGRLSTTNRHAGALNFFDRVMAGPADVYYYAGSHDFARVDGHTLMVRVANKQANWVNKTIEHERAMITAANDTVKPKMWINKV